MCPSYKGQRTLYGSQITGERTKTSLGGVMFNEGCSHSLICLQIQSCLGGLLLYPSPSELNNLNVELHTHVIINRLCPHSVHRRQNKNNVKSAQLRMATSRQRSPINNKIEANVLGKKSN